MEWTKRDYDRKFPHPLSYERALYCLGMNPLKSSEPFYKNLDIDGLAREFCKFEDLYDSNYQAYHWLFHTGYGDRIFNTIRDLVLKQGYSEKEATRETCDRIFTARRAMEK
jgi:hypothetical protein